MQQNSHLLAIPSDVDTSPHTYVESFNALAAWTDNSLDLYRKELARVLYPIFLHFYIELVKRAATAEAHRLFTRHKVRFLEWNGTPSRTRKQELADLQTMAVAAHVLTNRTAQSVLSVKYPVKLSVYAYQLLMQYLQAAKLHLPLGVLNRFVQLEVVDGQLSLPDGEELEGIPAPQAGQQRDAITTTNQRPVLVGLLEGLAEPAPEAAEAPAEELAAEEKEGKEKEKGKKGKQAAGKAKKKEEREPAAATTMQPEIPLPAVPDEARQRMRADMEARAALSPSALPSAALFTFVNTAHALNCVAFTPDGERVAGGFEDSSVRVYDIPQLAASRAGAASTSGADAGKGSSSGQPGGQEVLALWGHSAAVYAAAFSADQQLLFSAAGDGTARLWSMELGANLVAYRGHNSPVWDVAACPLGYYFATAGNDWTARMWCTERTHALRILAGHQADVNTVRWHPNCHLLGTGSADSSVRLWDVRDGQAARVLPGHRAAITSIAFSSDGRQFVSGDEDGTVMVWDIAAAKRLATLKAHTGSVWTMGYSYGPNPLLATGGADNCLRLWNVDSAAEALAGTADAGRQDDSAACELKCFRTKATPVLALTFTPRNLLLASGALTITARR